MLGITGVGLGSTQPAAWKRGVPSCCTVARVVITGTTVTGFEGSRLSRAAQPLTAVAFKTMS